ncbi:hypothetical protein RQP46_002128 [Phenoliferia psychrophenolica]
MFATSSRTLLRAAPRMAARRSIVTSTPIHRCEATPISTALYATGFMSFLFVVPMWIISVNGAKLGEIGQNAGAASSQL